MGAIYIYIHIIKIYVYRYVYKQPPHVFMCFIFYSDENVAATALTAAAVHCQDECVCPSKMRSYLVMQYNETDLELSHVHAPRTEAIG